ncbi:MAG: fimbrillin family protein [Bacteroides sp.]
MKTKQLMILAAVAVSLAACNNEDSSQQENQNGAIILRTHIGTRAAIDAQDVQIATDGKVGVFINEQTLPGATGVATVYEPLVYTADGTGILALAKDLPQPFFPQSGNGVNIIAYCPFSVTWTDKAIAQDFTVEADQSTDAKMISSDLLYGEPTIGNPVVRVKTAVDLTFKHTLSKVIINLTSGKGAPDLNGAKVTILGTENTTGFMPATGALSPAHGGANVKPILSGVAPDGIVPLTSYSCAAVIVPQRLSAAGLLDNKFIQVKLKAGGTVFYKLADDAIFESGKKNIYDLIVDLTEITLGKSQIIDWTLAAGGNVSGGAGMD